MKHFNLTRVRGRHDHHPMEHTSCLTGWFTHQPKVDEQFVFIPADRRQAELITTAVQEVSPSGLFFSTKNSHYKLEPLASTQ